MQACSRYKPPTNTLVHTKHPKIQAQMRANSKNKHRGGEQGGQAVQRTLLDHLYIVSGVI